MLDLGFLRTELKHTITTAEASLLVAPVTLSEVKEAFFDIDVESAPGPDGFTSAFYRAAWPIVGQSIFAFNSEGRSISDNILLAQELLAGYNQMRLPERCTLKLDIQKAYDSVEWDFLLAVLKLFNFPDQFIAIIEQCISTASFSVSLNGSIHGFFKGGRGLRQGDPMSPYLFVLVMEIWSSLLRHRIHNATHFQYHWKCKELGLVSRNPAKSQIILSRAVQQQRQQILEHLGFQEGSLPIKYLGIPLTSSRLTIADCRPLLDKVDTRLAGWNNQILTYAGRLQLIKSVLSTLHSYWASVFILPKGVLKNLEQKMRTFLWQGHSGRGNAKVAWDQICKPKTEGGLGISSLITTNQALILKQLWRILQNDGTSIWVDWVQHYRLRHATIWTLKRTTGSWSWKKILKLRHLLQRGVIYKVGDGSSFSLWQDIWHERGPLCLSYPRGPAVTGLPLSSTLSSVLQGNQWCWPASTDADIVEIMSQLPPTQPSQQTESVGSAHRNKVKFQWPYLEWKQGTTWASKMWRVLGEKYGCKFSLFSHTQYTETHTSSNISHAPAATVDDGEDGDLDDSDHGEVSAPPEMSTPDDSDPSMAKLKSEFNFKEFFELATGFLISGILNPWRRWRS
ncbi:UNVERIFIED_CONTAM: putative ribonuclease H protein [Sesamum angustifolium]|uniref:Ribonuclease H protein n=1 Tax=Sesamum angustifolium TaxID=2727405 RepID=A0AAW2JG17_9LAMI